MNSFFKKLATGTAALALTTTVFATTSFAATTDTSVTGGTMGLSTVSAGSFGTLTLDGTTKTVTAPINTFDVTDARGTGAGWNVAVSASAFTDSSVGGKTLSLSPGSFTVAAPTVTKIDDGSSALTTITAAGGTLDNSGTVKMLSAAKDGGMGSYTVAPATMTLKLKPGEVYAGSYSSTITVSLTTGP